MIVLKVLIDDAGFKKSYSKIDEFWKRLFFLDYRLQLKRIVDDCLTQLKLKYFCLFVTILFSQSLVIFYVRASRQTQEAEIICMIFTENKRNYYKRQNDW